MLAGALRSTSKLVKPRMGRRQAHSSSKPNILVTTTTTDSSLEAMRKIGNVDYYSAGNMPRDQLLKRVANVEGLYCVFKNKIDKELLNNAPKLKVISTMSVGFDHIDMGECKKRGIKVGNTPGVLTETTADLTVSLLCTTARRLPEASETVYNGKWGSDWTPFWMCGKDIHSSTVGIIGMGRIGQSVAKRLTGFGCKILYHGPREKKDLPVQATFVPKLEDLLSQSDYVIPLCLLNDETRGMFNEKTFKQMKKGAIFINAGRGQLVDQNALIAALRSAHLSAAGLDVTDPEPLPAGHPLLDPTLKDRLVIIPHIGSATMATRNKMADITTANLIAGLSGNAMPHALL